MVPKTSVSNTVMNKLGNSFFRVQTCIQGVINKCRICVLCQCDLVLPPVDLPMTFGKLSGQNENR
jgi:hypothetical protein